MKTNRIVAALMGVLACGILSFASTARAEDAPSNSSVPFWEKTKVTGTFDTSYNFNFNNPACPAAGWRSGPATAKPLRHPGRRSRSAVDARRHC